MIRSEMLLRSAKRQSNHFNVAQIGFGVAFFIVISLIYSCIDLETLRPFSQSLNRLPDIETRAHKYRRAFP